MTYAEVARMIGGRRQPHGDRGRPGGLIGGRAAAPAAAYTDHESALLLPIGHLRGIRHHQERPLGGSAYALRLGREVIDLPLNDFVVWSHAHGVQPHVQERAWMRSTVAEVVGNVGLTEPVQHVIDRLVRRGALAEVVLEPESEIAFARRHRVCPLMLGLGNTSDTPWIYRIGLPYAVMTTVLEDVYQLWDGMHLGDNLWSACCNLFNLAAEADVDLGHAGPADLLHDFLGELHRLLSASCLYIDLAGAEAGDG